MSYSAEHLFQLVSAFELINLGLPAFTATSIVENNWREIAAGFGLAIHEEFDDSRSRGAHRSIYLRIMQISLSSLMEEANEEVGAVFVEDLERLRMELEEEPEKPATSYLLLCASDIARNVLYAARRIAKVSDPETDEEFATWHTRLSPYAWWMLEGVEQTGED